MATITFSCLPIEIQTKIADYCENYDLINLCLTSKRLKEIGLRVLYRHVNLQPFDRYDTGVYSEDEVCRLKDARNRQEQIVDTLLNHPEYGKHIRSLKGMLCLPKFNIFNCKIRSWTKDTISEEELWRAMQFLTHVQNVDVGSRNNLAYYIKVPTNQFPSKLFWSATSVRLAGFMQYGLAKSILQAINPATLVHLSLDMVQDRKIAQFHREYVGRDGLIPKLHSMSGLLTTLTGHCTALRTLILRREGLYQYDDGKDEQLEAAEAPTYIEWASFIGSVTGTLERFTFEYSGVSLDIVHVMNEGDDFSSGPFRNLGESFRRLVLPTIVLGDWPCLTFIQLRGIRSTHAQVGKDALTKQLTAALGRGVKILVMEDVGFFHCEP